MTRRNFLFALVLNLVVAATAAWAQQPKKIPIVAYLAATSGPDDPHIEVWRQELRELGYVDGRTIKIEFRSAQGHAERLPGLAQELIQLKVDVIVVGSTPAAQAVQAVQRATSIVPIVVILPDPVGSGLVGNLAHPGGNVTGLSMMSTELTAKRLQLLKEVIPRITRVAVLWNPDTPFHAKVMQDLKATAPSLSIKLSFVGVRTPEEFDTAFSAVSRAHAQALFVIESSLFFAYRTTLVNLASKARLPAMVTPRELANEGGLICYGANYDDAFRRSAAYVDKILKGAKPGDLPIEQPTKFELVVNLKTAKALGITIPQSILLQADEVIR
jgi:putative ABC transport system substrate-binding protein